MCNRDEALDPVRRRVDARAKSDAAIVLDLSPCGNLREAAANLFDYMKRADASGAATIAFGPDPSEGLGEAILDRLQRAAAQRLTDRHFCSAVRQI